MNAVVRLHQSLEAEQAVLGGLMLDNRRWEDAASVVTADDFTRADHRVIFAAMAELLRDSQPFDAVTLAEALNLRGDLDRAGGLAYLATLARDTPTAANVGAYAKIVRDRSVLRQTLKIAETLRSEVNGGEPAAADNAITALMRLGESAQDHEHAIMGVIREANDELDKLNQAQGRLVGVSSGLTELDQCLGGFQGGDLISIGARPSAGKTALLLNIAAKCGVPCGFISAEQSRVQLGLRLISIHGRVSVHKMRTADLEDEDWKRVLVGGSTASKQEIWINDKPAPKIAEVMRQARKWKQRHGIRILLVDYLQRIKADNPELNYRERVTETAQCLKQLARELNIPVVALAMVNRQVEQREDKRPGLSDFKESGAIEEESDQVLTLYRNEVYHPEDMSQHGIAELSVLKNRHGPIGLIKCAWQKEYMRFEDLAPRDRWSPP